MNDSLASLLMKNIDLILEAFEVDAKGNLVEGNKKKVAEADEIFHNYFVKRMNQTFRQINESDPILTDPMNMHPQGTMHGMHGMGQPHGMGMGDEGDEMGGIGGDEHMGRMAMDDMHAMGSMDNMQPDEMNGGGMPSGMMSTGGMGGGMMGESQEGEYDWVFDENTDMEIDSLFKLNEEDDEEEQDECMDEEDERLDEFMDDEMMHGGDSDFLPNGGMDMEGGHNDFGGDMGGMDMGGDDMGGDMGGDDGDMMTVHGHMDNGGEFEFKFDPETLGFDGGDMGGDEGMGDMGGDMGHEAPEHSMDQPGMGGEEEDDNPVHEAAGGFHNGKPGKGKRGPKTANMAVVPANPATHHAAPFPSPMGNKRSKK